jgi:Tfp pilus assembly protein PilN
MGYQRVPNFNLIPPEYRRAIVPRRRLIIYLLLLLMIVVVASFIPGLYQRMGVHEAAIEALGRDIAAIEAELAMVSAERDEAEELLTTIRGMKEEHQALLNQRQQDWRELGVNRAEWHRVTFAVFRSRLFGVELSSIGVQEMEVALSGTAPDYAALLRYRRALLTDPTIAEIISFDSEIVEGDLPFSLVVRIGEE